LSGNDVEHSARHADDQALGKRTLEIKNWPGLTPDEETVAAEIAHALEQDLESYIQQYKQLPETDSGRIVSADNAKELFPQYSASSETRTQFTYAVHPASAVLAKEIFRRKLGEPRLSEERVVYLVTGPPGAGKTMAHGRDVERRVKAVFEGNITTLSTIFGRINHFCKTGHFRPQSRVNKTTDVGRPMESPRLRALVFQDARPVHVRVLSDPRAQLRRYRIPAIPPQAPG
jgi:hypothetical protein